jgi:two-component system response regulator DesR
MSHKVMIVEDQTLLLGAIAALIDMDDELQVVAQCRDGRAALDWLHLPENAANLPHIVLTDIEMPQVSGLELTQQVVEDFPAIQVMIMTTFSRAGYVRRAIDCGARGFILKESSSDELIADLKRVLSGQRVIDPELAINALGVQDPLSDKERQALLLASQGLTTQQIAEKLFLSPGTVRNYLSEAIAKLHAENRVDAARIARHKGWL